MDNILMNEVNQHTSDEVAKVLAGLQAQGVDIAALQAALEAQGTNIGSILEKVQQSGGGLTSCIRKIQRGTGSCKSATDITLSGFSNVGKMIVLLNGTGGNGTSTASSVGSGSNELGVDFYVSSLSATNLEVRLDDFLNYQWSGLFSYQVIEFY